MAQDTSGIYSYGYAPDGSLVPYYNDQRNKIVSQYPNGGGQAAYEAMLATNEQQSQEAQDPAFNPWALDANQLQTNSTFLPKNYFVTGNNSGTNVNTMGLSPGQEGGYGNPSAPPTSVPGASSGQSTSATGATPYPTMPNSLGLGTQTMAPIGTGTPAQTSQPAAQSSIAGNASNPNYATQELSAAVSDSGSRGFNPWSMQGEANARSVSPQQ